MSDASTAFATLLSASSTWQTQTSNTTGTEEENRAGALTHCYFNWASNSATRPFVIIEDSASNTAVAERSFARAGEVEFEFIISEPAGADDAAKVAVIETFRQNISNDITTLSGKFSGGDSFIILRDLQLDFPQRKSEFDDTSDWIVEGRASYGPEG